MGLIQRLLETEGYVIERDQKKELFTTVNQTEK